MADQRDDWRRDRDRALSRPDDRGRRDEPDRYGRSEYGRGEAWRGSDRDDWRRNRGDYDPGYPRGRDAGGREARGREDWAREQWGRGREPGRGYGRDSYGREDWGRGYGRGTGYESDIGRRATGGGVPGGAWGFDESWGRDPGWGRGWEPTGYGRAGYGRDYYGERTGYGNDRRNERGWWDRASDEVSSWFGDDDAERRRQEDERGRDYHRGRGPRGYTRSDERIREDVSDRLTDNPILDASEIEVMVSDGEVTLSGSVDSRYSKRLAEDLADEVSGVKHTQNNLRVRQVPPQRESISGTSSGIAERGATSDVGRTGTGVSGSTGVGNTSGSMTGKPDNADAVIGGTTSQTTRPGTTTTR
jgi:osmotically-inducible protein OsmY